MPLSDIEISRAIIERYTEKLLGSLETDVAIVGAGPSGLTAAYCLAEKGFKTVLFERALKPGGGMPGGGMMFSEIVIQREAKPVLEDLGRNEGHFPYFRAMSRRGMTRWSSHAESDECGTMNAGRGHAGLVETMRMTADGLRPAAYGPE